MAQGAKLGRYTGLGLVVANMVGSGVFLSAGFMAQELDAAQILLAWAVGGVLAVCGAVAYAEVARRLPGSGGEYHYLSALYHPALGSVAGWASVLVGFSAPIAIDALGASGFLERVFPGLPVRALAVGLVLLVAVLHSVALEVSVAGQNLMVAVKVMLLLGFIAAAVAFGQWSWPTWTPPSPRDSAEPFFSSLFYIAFAFSGWNAAVYAAGEFERPERDVPWAMAVGCVGVGVLYALLNYIFVANVTPADATAVFHQYGTLAHVVARNLLGEDAARLMSGFVALLLVSALGAMMLLGPRVYAAMARGGVLPRLFEGREGRPPVASVWLQAGVAILLISVQSLKNVLQNVGAVLMLFAALTVLGVFRFGRDGPRVSVAVKAAAAVYASASLLLLWRGFQGKTGLLPWVAGLGALGLVAWSLGRRRAV